MWKRKKVEKVLRRGLGNLFKVKSFRNWFNIWNYFRFLRKLIVCLWKENIIRMSIVGSR